MITQAIIVGLCAITQPMFYIAVIIVLVISELTAKCPNEEAIADKLKSSFSNANIRKMSFYISYSISSFGIAL